VKKTNKNAVLHILHILHQDPDPIFTAIRVEIFHHHHHRIITTTIMDMDQKMDKIWRRI
jgi:hypothetical protein